jgi:hypothetical protein
MRFTRTTNQPPSLGGGSYYPGGSRSSYRSGGRSPGGLVPGLVPGAAFGFGFGALYLYQFHSHYPYYYNNSTHSNQSLPIDCVCDQNAPCGCDDTNNATAVQEMLKNTTVAKVEQINGTTMVVINGTLLNGTDTSAAGRLTPFARQSWNEVANWWPVVAVVGTMVWGL